jgi:hypothetical protein
MFTPPAPPGIRIGPYGFSVPQPWHQAVPPVGGGLYALVAAGPGAIGEWWLVSVGEAENLRATFFKLRAGPLMPLVRDHKSRLHVAWLQTTPDDSDCRKSIEAEIIRDFLPSLRTYKLFLSHSWGHNEEYDGLVSLLNKAVLHFRWENLSITVGTPVMPNPVLRRSYRSVLLEVESRIRQADCVLVLAGMYGSFSPWIQSEIEAAQDIGRPIIGVEPNGQQRVPQEVRNAAREMVGWRSESVIGAIRRAVP